MAGLSRKAWVRDYMRIMDDEYGDYGFCDDPVPSDEEIAEEWDAVDTELKRSRDRNSPSGISEADEECNVPKKVTKIKDIEVPEDEKKLKRDLWMETLRRLEQAARTVTDFNNLGGWYDYLEDLKRDRVRKHELLRNGDDYPIEYGENEDSALFAGSLSSVIARQMRKGDLLDAIYCKPDTIDQLVTSDYMIHFMRAIDKDDRELFFYKVLDGLSSAEIAEMRGQSDRAVRKAWRNLLFHLKQRTMGVLIFRSDKDYSLTRDEQEFLDTCREQYEFKIEAVCDS